MFIIEMFRQAFHTYNQNWKKLIFFSVGIGLVIDIIGKYIISYWGYHILAVPFTPGASIGEYVFTHLSTAFSPLVYLLVLFNSVFSVITPVFYTLPILYLLIYPELCQSLSPLEILKRTAPYRKPFMLLSLFSLISFCLWDSIGAIFPSLLSFFSEFNNNFAFICVILVIVFEIIFDGINISIIQNHMGILSAFKDTCKIFIHRFFSAIVLVYLMTLLFSIISTCFFWSSSEPVSSFIYFFKHRLFDFSYPFNLFAIYYALNRKIIFRVKS